MENEDLYLLVFAASWANVADFAESLSTLVVSLPKSILLSRGQAQYQELGYGPNGKKSSANPEKCFALENVYTHQVCKPSSLLQS